MATTIVAHLAVQRSINPLNTEKYNFLYIGVLHPMSDHGYEIISPLYKTMHELYAWAYGQKWEWVGDTFTKTYAGN